MVALYLTIASDKLAVVFGTAFMAALWGGLMWPFFRWSLREAAQTATSIPSAAELESTDETRARMTIRLLLLVPVFALVVLMDLSLTSHRMGTIPGITVGLVALIALQRRHVRGQEEMLGRELWRKLGGQMVALRPSWYLRPSDKGRSSTIGHDPAPPR